MEQIDTCKRGIAMETHCSQFKHGRDPLSIEEISARKDHRQVLFAWKVTAAVELHGLIEQRLLFPWLIGSTRLCCYSPKGICVNPDDILVGQCDDIVFLR